VLVTPRGLKYFHIDILYGHVCAEVCVFLPHMVCVCFLCFFVCVCKYKVMLLSGGKKECLSVVVVGIWLL